MLELETKQSNIKIDQYIRMQTPNATLWTMCNI